MPPNLRKACVHRKAKQESDFLCWPKPGAIIYSASRLINASPASDAWNMGDPNFNAENCEPLAPSASVPPPSPFRWLFGIGALFSPFVVMALFIIATREWIIVDTQWDYLGGALSVATGLFCVWRLPIPRLSRALISVIYTPILGYLLIGFSLGFVMRRYNVWL